MCGIHPADIISLRTQPCPETISGLVHTALVVILLSDMHHNSFKGEMMSLL